MLEAANDSPMDVLCFQYPTAIDQAGKIYGYVTEFFSITSQGKLFQYEIQTIPEQPIYSDFYTSDLLGHYSSEVLSDPYANTPGERWIDSDTGYKFTFNAAKRTMKATPMDATESAGLQKLAGSRYSPLTYEDLLVNFHTVELSIGELSEDVLNITDFREESHSVKVP